MSPQTGLDREGGMGTVGVCFSTLDLYSWKENTKGVQADPEGFISLISGILMTHNPTWEAIQSFLTTFLTAEEKSTMLLKSKEEAVKKHTTQPNNRI